MTDTGHSYLRTRPEPMADDHTPDDVKEAIDVLRGLLLADSPEVRRKAAMDILTINNAAHKKHTVPPPTEDQLEHIGRVLLEAETIRLVSIESEG